MLCSGDLLEQTQNQTENSDTDIRTYAIAYYWSEIVAHPLTMIFGAGAESGAAAYGSQFHMFDRYWLGWSVGGPGGGCNSVFFLHTTRIQIFFRKKLEVPGYVRSFAFLSLVNMYSNLPLP